MISASGGLFHRVAGPEFGRQELGYAPAGALDRFSFYSGNAVLSNPENAMGLEIILPPALVFETQGHFILTGASVASAQLHGSKKPVKSLRHARVYRAEKGDTLVLKGRGTGFRTYLCLRPGRPDSSLESRDRGGFADIATWPDPSDVIRAVRGPEYGILTDPGELSNGRFRISSRSSDMGLLLEGPKFSVNGRLQNMVSAPVADGTVQLAPGAPIVLLRRRQTVGGYPRIFNIINPDVDRLAQYAPGQSIRFREIDLAEAREAGIRYQEDLSILRSRFTRTVSRD